MIIKRKFQLKNHELITFTHLYEKNIRIINFKKNYIKNLQ